MLPAASRIFVALAFLYLPASVLAQSSSSGSSAFVSVSDGGNQICAVDIDGALHCNQSSASERLAPPENLPPLTMVEAGSVHACGITWDGAAVCWGDNDFGQLDVPSDIQFSSVSAGLHHSCGITTTNEVVCWGLGSNGQTSPRFADADEFGRVDGELIQFVALDLADNASCGLDTSGNVRCWGDSVTTFTPQSLDADEQLDVDAFAVGKRRFPFLQQCALLSDGTIECLNDNYIFNGLYTDVAAFGRHMCALDLDGILECQRDPFSPQGLLDWELNAISLINTGDPLVSIEGASGLCGLTASGEARCLLSEFQNALRVPGTAQFSPAAPDDLTAAIYSDTTIELLWSDRNIAAWQVAYAEIFRDGELLTTTTQLRSFIDSSLEPGRSYSYRVRYVAIAGGNGEFSSTINVNTLDRNNPAQPSADGYVPPIRFSEPTDLQVSVYSQELLELQWARVPDTMLGYEIRRDGQYIGYTAGVSFLDRSISSGGDYVYEVIAVNRDGEIQGVAMTRVVVQ